MGKAIASALSSNVRAGVGSCGLPVGASPAMSFLGSDSGPFSSLGEEEFGVAAVGVSPSQVGMKAPGQYDVVGVVGVVQHEFS